MNTPHEGYTDLCGVVKIMQDFYPDKTYIEVLELTIKFLKTLDNRS